MWHTINLLVGGYSGKYDKGRNPKPCFSLLRRWLQQPRRVVLDAGDGPGALQQALPHDEPPLIHRRRRPLPEQASCLLRRPCMC